ncbi:MAG: hypothetical protein ACYCSN_07625 [Acidobacteriaceae bacterium]
MNESPTAAGLIERAFSLARQSGKSDWWAMTIPVLKNRLLLLTNNTFKESDFGAVSYRDFLTRNSSIVRIQEMPPPGFVILRSAAPDTMDLGEPPSKLIRGDQIRTDLWLAMLDYSSGRKYVWDISEQAARAALPDEDGLILPTASPSDLDEWRAEFVESHKSTDSDESRRVDDWRANRLPTAALPATMRPIWTRYLKRKVQGRLQQWFASNSIELPAIVPVKAASAALDRQLETLRDFVVGCVRVMSRQELLEIRISASTALRMQQIEQAKGVNER